jgi:hypothetical protein
MKMNFIPKSMSKFLIATFNPFNISQLYFALLDYRFSSVMTNEKHFVSFSAGSIAMMFVFTVIIFFLSIPILDLKLTTVQKNLSV